MKKLGIVVAGLGHLGKFHCQKIQQHPRAELRAVIDTDPAQCRKFSDLYQVSAYESFEAFKADEATFLTTQALVCAAPTAVHHTLGTQALRAGLHLLVEKPITQTLAQADALLALQEQTGLVLQVGHCERFNVAIEAALPLAHGARFMTAERLGPFSGRSADIDVILDVMIHDIDLSLAIFGGNITEIHAIGVPIVTEACDMAHVRLAFDKGQVAQLAAGRASFAPSRKIRLFTPERYVSIDCQAKQVRSIMRNSDAVGSVVLLPEDVKIAEGDSLSRQLEAFVVAIETKSGPRVGAEMGRHCLAVAEQVKEAIARQDALFRTCSPLEKI